MTQPDLIPEVTVVTHPVDTTVHPTYQAGWRWAVMIGGAPPADTDRCVGALLHDTELEAGIIGEQAGAAVARALMAYGIPVRCGRMQLGYDPIPAEADDRPIGVWRAGVDQAPTDATGDGR